MPLRDPLTAQHFNGAVKVRGINTWIDGRRLSIAWLARLAGAPDGATLSIRNEADGIAIALRHADLLRGAAHMRITEGSDGTTLTLERLRVRIPGQGLGARMFAHQVHAAAALGFTRIVVAAAGTLDPTGRSRHGHDSYARFGCDAPWAPLLWRLPVPLALATAMPDTVQALLATDFGPAWWRAQRVDVDMVFELRRGSPARSRLDRYMTERGIAIGAALWESQ